MHKNHSDSVNFLARVASHATKGSRTGDTSNIPVPLVEVEYRTIKERYDDAAKNLFGLTEEVAHLRRRLMYTLPFEEYERVSSRVKKLGPIVSVKQNEIGNMKEIARALAHESWAETFYAVANLKLRGPDHLEALLSIENEVAELLGRSHQELKKTTHGRHDNEAAKHKNNRRKNFKLSLKKLEHRDRRNDDRN